MAEKGVIIRPAYYESINSLGEKSQLALYRAICDFGLHGQEPMDLPPVAQTVFVVIRASLEADARRYAACVANGKKGGGQKGNQNARKRPKNDQTVRPKNDQTIQPKNDLSITNTITKTNTKTNTKTKTSTSVSASAAAAMAPSEQRERKKTFSPPSVQEVEAYCQAQGYSSLAQPFVDYYESVGWLVGKKPMRDWKAAVRSWNRKQQRAEQPASFALAPAEDPFEAAIREGRYV